VYYRKKPVVIQAWQLLEENLPAPDWMTGKFTAPLQVQIDTLEGVMTAKKGDWIIRGVQGEIYPCKPDIFEATYEPASIPATSIFAVMRKAVCDLPRYSFLKNPSGAVCKVKDIGGRWIEFDAIDDLFKLVFINKSVNLAQVNKDCMLEIMQYKKQVKAGKYYQPIFEALTNP